MKSYRYGQAGLAQVAGALAPRTRRPHRWPAIALFAVFLGIFCRAEMLRGSADAAPNPAARSNEMNLRMAGAAVALMVAGAASAQSAVQWRVEDGGNGHWYAWSSWGAFTSSATAASEASRYGAHLVTLTSAAEEAFVQSIAPLGSCQDLAHSEALIGAFQSPGSVEPSGGWQWITGEAMIYTDWRLGEPNNGGGIENTGYLNRTGGWNDGGDTGLGCAHSAIFEWSADCNSDGIVDFGQIRSGELADANANNIPDCCENGTVCGCPADIVQDGAVNGVDLAAVINAWGTDGGKLPRSDVNHDGIVNGADLAQVLGSWGACP